MGCGASVDGASGAAAGKRPGSPTDAAGTDGAVGPGSANSEVRAPAAVAVVAWGDARDRRRQRVERAEQRAATLTGNLRRSLDARRRAARALGAKGVATAGMDPAQRSAFHAKRRAEEKARKGKRQAQIEERREQVRLTAFLREAKRGHTGTW